MDRKIVLLALLGLHLRFTHGDRDSDDDVFTCKPSRNFEKKVNDLIYKKMQVYEDLKRDMKEVKQYANLDEEKVRIMEREMERMKGRLRALEEKTGTTLTDCPTSGQSGIYTVFGLAYPEGIQVYCDTETDGGGWTVFQLRKNGMLNFDREWSDYLNGFGSLDEEFWFGFKQLRRILSSGEFEIRVDLLDWDGKKAYAVYSNFQLSGEESNFALTLSGYKGSAGDSMDSGVPFSTKDKDNDRNIKGNCAKDLKGGWWFTNCNLSHLNGKYYKGGHYSPKDNSSPIDGISWYYWKNTKLYSMKATAMKIRKK